MIWLFADLQEVFDEVVSNIRKLNVATPLSSSARGGRMATPLPSSTRGGSVEEADVKKKEVDELSSGVLILKRLRSEDLVSNTEIQPLSLRGTLDPVCLLDGFQACFKSEVFCVFPVQLCRPRSRVPACSF